MPQPRWLILAALNLEAHAIAREFGASFARGADELILSDGVFLRKIGLRAARLNAEMCRGFDCLVLAGLAGGLDPALQAGDVVVDQITGAMERVDALTSGGDSMALSGSTARDKPVGPRILYGPIYSAGQIIATRDAKAELHRRTGALAVDMESTAVGAIARQLGIPLVHIRAISDTASQSLDPDALRWMTNTGGVRPGAVALGLLRRPVLIPALIRLGRQTQMATRKLAITVRQWVT